MDKNSNHTQSTNLLYVGFGIKIIELVFVIFTMAYFCGILWIVQCELVEDFYYDMIYEKVPEEDRPPGFLTYYKLTDKTAEELTLISLYFSLTSLTTIGLGDFVPRNSPERIVCSFMLLFGVAIFSYIMNNLLSLVNQYDEHTGEYDDGDELNRFFGTLTKFNKDKPIDQKLRV